MKKIYKLSKIFVIVEISCFFGIINIERMEFYEYSRWKFKD